MNWQAWAIQGVILLVLAGITALGIWCAITLRHPIPRIWWALAAALLTLAAVSFSVAGWVAPWPTH